MGSKVSIMARTKAGPTYTLSMLRPDGWVRMATANPETRAAAVRWAGCLTENLGAGVFRLDCPRHGSWPALPMEWELLPRHPCAEPVAEAAAATLQAMADGFEAYDCLRSMAERISELQAAAGSGHPNARRAEILYAALEPLVYGAIARTEREGA